MFLRFVIVFITQFKLLYNACESDMNTSIPISLKKVITEMKIKT